MCPTSYHHSGFMATHALGQMIDINVTHANYSEKRKYENLFCN